MAVAAGENISGLDNVDFYIRHLRRHGRDDDLRMLKFRENPDPAEISVSAHREWTTRMKAWEMRYLGPQPAPNAPQAADTRH